MTDTSHIEVLREMFAECANDRRMKEAYALEAAIRALSPAGGDWVMVPREPTKEMCAAGERERLSRPTNMNPYHVWAAMLAASPQQEPGAGELCKTCGGHGVVCYHTGQTPEQYEEHTEDCPDCTPSGQTLAGAGGDVVIEAVGRIVADDEMGARVDWLTEGGIAAMEVGDFLCVTNATIPDDGLLTLTATSAGTTGDDSEDAARLDWLESQFKDGVHVEGCYSGAFSAANLQRHATVFYGSREAKASTIRDAIDTARRAREVGK